jgi:hypothetical protein
VAVLPGVSLTHVPDEILALRNARNELQQWETQIVSQLELESSERVISTISDLQGTNEKNQLLLTGLQHLLKTTNASDFVPRIEQLINEKRELERKLTGSMNVSSPSAAFKQIAQVKQWVTRHEELSAQLCRLLNIDDEDSIAPAVSSLVQNVHEFTDREEQIMVSLAVASPDRILAKLDEAQLANGRWAQILDVLLTTLNCRKESDLVERVVRLVERKRTLAQSVQQIAAQLGVSSADFIGDSLEQLQAKGTLITELCRVLSVSQPDLLKSAVIDLIDTNHRLQSLGSLFPPDLSEYSSLKDKIAIIMKQNQDFVQERGKLSSLLNSNDLFAAASQLRENLDTASQLFSRLLGILSRSPMKISYPLSRALQDRLVSLITDFKDRADRSQKQLEMILGRAASLGYSGASAVEAVDFIAASDVQAERHKLSAQQHQELMDVRSTHERERERATKQKAKSKENISDLRNEVALLNSKRTRREEELIAQLDAERAELRGARDDLENERKIREQLITVISGSTADTAYLRAKLSDTEVRQLDRAEDVRRRVEQLLAATAEGSRVLEMQRKPRDDAATRSPKSMF